MRLSYLGLMLVVAACSGDDGHKQQTLHPQVAPEVTAAGSASPADAVPPPSPVAAAPEAMGPPAPLSEEMATPYFQTGAAAAGAAAFARQAWPDAITEFTKARLQAKGIDGARLDLMIGLALEQQRSWEAASKKLQAAALGLPLLADYIGYHTARTLYFAQHTAAAFALASRIPKDSIVGADAEMLTGDLLRGMGESAKVAAHYKDYLARRPDGPRRSEARFRLGEALEASRGDVAEALRLYRLNATNDPLSSWAAKSSARIAALAPANTYTPAEQITRAKQLFDAMRNPESEAAFTAALAEPTITAGEKCVAAYHAAQARFKARDRKGAAPMFDAATIACKAANNIDLVIKSIYQAGRSYAFIGDHTTAVEKYQAAQKVDPTHSYSDDALLREAEEWSDLNDDTKVEATLSALPVRFPQGDNVAEAMWRLGWRAWRANKLDDAIGWWRKQIALVPHDDNYFGEGQAQYWLGRAYLAKNKKKEALDIWEAGVKQYPAAYYALQALNRIRDTDEKRYAKVIADISTAPTGFDPAAPAFTFKPRPEYGTLGFARAMELMRLGLGDPAAAELRKLGLNAPTDKKHVDDPDTIEKLWAISYLYDRAGRYATSHWPTRWAILDYRKDWPTGANRARWQVAYPKAFWELLDTHATANKVPVALQIAIVREESAFNPRTESYANAWGLTQMIPPTAKQYAKGTGIAPTRENMFDPEKNVTVGSRFLGTLVARFKGFLLLVPPSYNAGPGAVRRWLKPRGTWDADEFIEAIVDDQARNYSKRVLGTMFTYAWLYAGVVPPMPNTIPAELVPKP